MSQDTATSRSTTSHLSESTQPQRDPAHVSPPRPEQPPRAEHPAPAAQQQSAVPADSGSLSGLSSIAEDALLADASRVFEQLRIRLAELDHRESSLQKKHLELDQRQTRHNRWVEQTTADLTKREEKLNEGETSCGNREADLNARIEGLNRQREAFAAEQRDWQKYKSDQEKQWQEIEAELDQLRRKRLQELERAETEADERMKTERRQFQEECREKVEEIQHTEAQAARRIKLQEDHLERLRTQVQQQRHAWQVESQQIRERQQHFATINRNRAVQTTHARELLDYRQAQQQRQTELSQAELRQLRNSVNEARTSLERDKTEWQEYSGQQNHLLETRSARLDRQEQILLLQSEQLQKLRTELEQMHRHSLELRLATEEMQIEFAVDRGESPDLDRLNDAKDQLGQHFRTAREQVEQLSDGLTNQRKDLEKQLAELKSYKQQSRKWIANGLEQWEKQRLAAEQTRQQVQQERSRWEAAQSKKLYERREAEQIIAGLLAQLEQTEEEASTALIVYDENQQADVA